MSSQHGDRAKYYRNKAEELRTIERLAQTYLAQTYDVMTRRAGQRIGESPDRKTSKPE